MKKLYGYVYNENGMHSQPIILDSNPENIAIFIARAMNAPKIIITDTGDELILNTMGNFIDYCEDKNFLKDLLEFLIPMQNRSVNPFKKKLKWSTMDIDGYTIDELKEMLANQLKTEFDYILE